MVAMILAIMELYADKHGTTPEVIINGNVVQATNERVWN